MDRIISAHETQIGERCRTKIAGANSRSETENDSIQFRIDPSNLRRKFLKTLDDAFRRGGKFWIAYMYVCDRLTPGTTR